MSEDVYRLFFALWPGDATRAQLAQSAAWLKNRHHPQGRWIGAHRYHLTLHFLGDYPTPPEALAARAMEVAALVQAQRFGLRMERAGSFRNRSIPWWLAPLDTPAPLRALHREIRDQLRAAGVPFDTSLGLTPHLTILRDASTPLPNTPVPPVDWSVDEFVLIQSRLGTRNEYTVLGRWPLSDAAPRGATRESSHDRQLDLWENPGSG